jgi:hypothetical protein
MALKLHGLVIPSVPGGMTTGALPVGLISLSDDDPEDKEGNEARGDGSRSKLSNGNQNVVIKTLWLKLESLLPEGKRKSSSDFRRSRCHAVWGPEDQMKRFQHKTVRSRHLPEGKRNIEQKEPAGAHCVKSLCDGCYNYCRFMMQPLPEACAPRGW